MNLFFVTSNKGKFSELQGFIPEIQQLDLDLLEIQETDPKKIIQEKINEAYKKATGAIIVEDTSLNFHCLNGLPGPFVKWFVKDLGLEGLYNLANKMGDSRATAKTLLAYAKSTTKILYFEGTLNGNIVKPRGKYGFGWDPIFQPKNSNKTFAEMSQVEKSKTSHRSIAVGKLISYLKTND